MVSPRGNRLFSLTLGPIAKAFCGASTPADHRLMDRLFEPAAPDRFAEVWLEAKGATPVSDVIASPELVEA
jgi:type IV secretion system protein VirB4